jgi:hypothetical protein
MTEDALQTWAGAPSYPSCIDNKLSIHSHRQALELIKDRKLK